ncbi:MAG: LysR substrate-binding domain-containing protein [Pseudomonadota bacterium]
MNISQLAAFHAVMTSSTLTDAANRLGRTQPAVSAAVKSLEDQLGLKLFERRGRNLVPVPEAEYLSAEAASILAQIARIRQTMRGLGAGEYGKLNVAAMPGPVSMLFPRFIAENLGNDTDVKVSILARSSIQIAELARAQSIDFGFADSPEAAGTTDLYRAEIISGDCFVALPAQHLLASRSMVDLSDLDNEPMGTLQADHAHTKEVRSAFLAAGYRFNSKIKSQTFLPILQFVVIGRCCAILDPLTVVHVNAISDLSNALVVRPLSQKLRYRYAMITPRHRPASAIATKIYQAWANEVEHLLQTLQAAPIWESTLDRE